MAVGLPHGLKFRVETDHKMLVPLFSTKHLEELPLLSSMHPTPHDEALFHYCPCTRQGAGNYQHSLAAAADTSPADNLQEETRACVNLVLKSMPASEQSLKEIKQYQESDETCHAITNFCQLGWPSEKDLSPKLRKYFPMTADSPSRTTFSSEEVES